MMMAISRMTKREDGDIKGSGGDEKRHASSREGDLK